MPWRREAAMQQIGQLPPMTQEQEQRKTPGDKPLSSELLETLRRECLERSVCTRVARLPSVIEKAPQPIKLEPPFFKPEEASDVPVPKNPAIASSRTDKSHLRSPSRTLQQSVHQQNRHQHHNQIVRIPLSSVKQESVRGHESSESELRGPRSSPASVERSQRRPSTELSSPPPLQSAVQSTQQQQRHHQQQPQRHRAAEERLQGEGDMVCKKDDSEMRAGVAKCNYVLSDNYENLSGDESPASRSLEASNVDHKAIELFLPLVDAMEEQGQNDGSAGSKKVVSGTRLKWPHESPTAMTPNSPQEASAGSPTPRADNISTSRNQVVDDAANAASRWQLLKDLKNKKSKLGLLRKPTSAESSRGDDSGVVQPPPLTPPLQGDSPPPGARRPGRRPNPRPGNAVTPSAGDANQEGGAARLGPGRLPADDRGDGASTPTATTPPLRNGPRRRSRWKGSASQEDEDAGGAESGSNADYQLSSDEETSKSCSDQPTPPPLPPPAQSSHLGGKKQRKNSEDNHRRGSSSSLSGEQHGDESRYKRLAQELPGFNWLEQKIMGHGGGNFADASPSISKHVTREAPVVVAAAPASERTEQKAPTSPQEPKRVYPPGTDILSRSMSEIQDDCCDEDVGEEAPVMEATVIAAQQDGKAEGDEQPQEMVQQEIPRQILVTALPDTYTSDPRLSQVITSTALIRPQYPMEVHMARPNSALEMPMGAPGLSSAPMLTCVPQGMQEAEGEPRPSSKSQADAIPQGRAAPEEQSSDSDVLYLGVSRKSLSPGSEHSGGDNRTSVLSEAGKVSERSRSADNNVTQAAVAQKHRVGGSRTNKLKRCSQTERSLWFSKGPLFLLSTSSICRG
ncbi:hypothetical protein MTO96_023477 [Rhipicephalus appendiculatus]